MQLFRRKQYICTSCAEALKSSSRRGITSSIHGYRRPYSSTVPGRKPLRLAVLGSGPAGFYTAYRVMHKLQDAVVDMYEQLPAPYGLVRYGVAPDHPEVKVSRVDPT